MGQLASELESLKRRQRSDLMQWRVHLVAILSVIASFGVCVLRGNKDQESLIGIKRCGKEDWLIIANYTLFSACLTLWAIGRARKE